MIILDPEEESKTSHDYLTSLIWARFLVFLTYQVYGTYAHLFQKDNHDVSDPIAQALDPQVPKVWNPLCIVVPYNYIMSKLFGWIIFLLSTTYLVKITLQNEKNS